MFSEGVVSETTILAERYGWENQAMTGNVYRLIKGYLAGEYDIERVKQLAALSDWQLAKRQMTWFRRNPYIAWATLEDAEHYCVTQLSKNE
jgi:tRNA dimethylallyltransferase